MEQIDRQKAELLRLCENILSRGKLVNRHISVLSEVINTLTLISEDD